MNNFGRALRLALRYRWTLAASILAAVAVALLWVADIGALGPLATVLLRNQSLQKWIDNEIVSYKEKIVEQDAAIARLEAEQKTAAEDRLREIHTELGARVSDRTAQHTMLVRYEDLLKPIIDRWLPNDSFKTLLLLIGILMAATFVKDFFLVINSVLISRLTCRATLDLRKLFYRRTLRLDLAQFNEKSSSELMSVFTYDIDGVGGGISTLLGRSVIEPLKMIGCLIGAAWISWRLLLVSLLILPLTAFLVTRLSKSLKRANRRVMEEVSHLYTILQETFGGIKVVKAFTMERHERRRLHENCKQIFGKSNKIAGYESLSHPMIEVMGIAMICLGILTGAYLVLNQATHVFGIRMTDQPLTLVSLLVFYAMLVGASDPARKMSDVFNRLQRAAAAADRVYALYDREPTIHDPVKPVPLRRHSRELVFENIHFGYRPDQTVLQGIDLRIPYGETLAIVGPNGCGKTTLANLVPRFYDPTDGTVRLDGIDLRDVRLRDLRRQIGVVTQDPILFDDTVFNNIRYGTPGAKRQQVIDAAKQAHAHKFIESRLEHGYETRIGQTGNRLSGGERQRLALARAILRDPAILILDEATSQIDIESEQLIHKVLEQFTRDRTTILITHRLATLILADRILVMLAGRIVDIGTHDELTSRCEVYRRLYQVQFKETA